MWTKKSSKEMRKHLLQDVIEQEIQDTNINVQHNSELKHLENIFPNMQSNYLKIMYERYNSNLQQTVDEILKESQIASDQDFATHISENV